MGKNNQVCSLEHKDELIWTLRYLWEWMIEWQCQLVKV